MSDRPFHSPDARLAHSARDDAQRLTPGFSEAMHARVVKAIDQLDVPVLRIERAETRSTTRHWITPLAMAASIALLVVPGFVLTPKAADSLAVHKIGIEKTSPANAHKPQLAVYSTAHDVNTKVQDVVQTAMAQEQYAGLDHDVRAATQYLVNQVPLRSAWESAGAEGER